jgi:hypothetical protein
MENKGFGIWIFFFCCGFVLINYPFIRIFDKPIFIFKIPLLYFYFFIGWFLSILVIFLFAKYYLKHEE